MTSAISPLKRFSNSPFTDAPACNAPRSRVMISVFFSLSGTWPATMRSASPSIKALLPTPAYIYIKSALQVGKKFLRLYPKPSDTRPG